MMTSLLWTVGVVGGWLLASMVAGGLLAVAVTARRRITAQQHPAGVQASDLHAVGSAAGTAASPPRHRVGAAIAEAVERLQVPRGPV